MTGDCETLHCLGCGRKLRVPALDRELSITCPACRATFSHGGAAGDGDHDGTGRPHVSACINPHEYRTAGEGVALAAGIGVLALVALAFAAGDLWFIPLILVAYAIIAVWLTQGQFLGSAVKVSRMQFPEIDYAASRAAARLGMEPPEVFVVFGPEINAFALGILRKKSVVLQSALVEAMNDDELLFVLGHEFSHVKCGHTFFHVLTSSAGGVSVPLISHGLEFVFRWWSRKAEYTADRGGVLASRSVSAAINSMCKLAVGPELYKKMAVAHFADQQVDVDRDQTSKLSESLLDHPYLVKRIRAARQFHNSPLYRELAARTP